MGCGASSEGKGTVTDPKKPSSKVEVHVDVAPPAPAVAATEESGPPPERQASAAATETKTSAKEEAAAAHTDEKSKKRERRAGIRGERIKEGDAAKVVPKPPDVEERLMKNIGEHFFFTHVEQEDRKMLVDVMSPMETQEGDEVMTQGEQGDFLYVIDEGEFDIIVGEPPKVIDVAKPGELVGELALMFGHPRTATVRSKGVGKLWALGRVDFRAAMSRSSQEHSTNLVKFLSKVPLLSELRDYQRMRVAEALKSRPFLKEDVIQKAGDVGKFLYIITRGEVLLTPKERAAQKEENGESEQAMVSQEPKHLGVGDFFGEASLLADDPLEYTAQAISDVECYVMDRASFDTMLGPLRKLLERTHDMRLLESIPILQQAFEKLTDHEREAVLDAFEHVSKEHGDYIITQGEEGDAFYIVRSGTVIISREVDDKLRDGPAEKFILKRAAGEYFGEMALMDGGTRAGHAIAKGPVSLARLSREAFEHCVGPVKHIMERETSERRHRIEKGAAQTLKLTDLKMHQTLGTGAFGRVKLIEWESKPYALKCLKKSEVIKLGQQEHVKNEAHIMSIVKHPFIMRLVTTFKDDVYVYMMLELIQGGELFRRISMLDDALSSDEARFYAANVVSALEYMAMHDIVYRDLKPENLLIDKDGYLKVVDFGCAKIVSSRTFTLCGSPEYVAPEVLLGKGYNRGVDIWSLGVLVYELAVGFSPFNPSQNLGHLQVCTNIIQGNFSFPKFFKDAVLIDAIRGFLMVDPSQRLGMMVGGFSDIRNHPWFKGFDWLAMEERRLKAPWIPPLKDAHDTSMFDTVEEEWDEEPADMTRDDCPGWDDDF